MKTFNICFGILIALSASRFIPHPPNFTSLLALTFYIPVFFGLRYLPFVIISFAITDMVIGYHTGTHWTWGSILLIGLAAPFFKKNITSRIGGAFLGACVFFLITNFGVWASGMYGYTYQGLVSCFILAVPFFAYTATSTLLFSAVIETIYQYYKTRFLHN